MATHDPNKDPYWQKVIRTVTPLRPGSAKPTRKDQFAKLLRLPPEEIKIQKRPLRSVDQLQDKRYRRGRVQIDATIDLHDMTRAQALPALKKFIIRAYNRNLKTVLVITGKGARLDGVLRNAFTSWIDDPDIRPIIAGYAQAHQKHGGLGAWYVMLKSS